jgi:hypothetical protein
LRLDTKIAVGLYKEKKKKRNKALFKQMEKRKKSLPGRREGTLEGMRAQRFRL